MQLQRQSILRKSFSGSNARKSTLFIETIQPFFAVNTRGKLSLKVIPRDVHEYFIQISVQLQLTLNL